MSNDPNYAIDRSIQLYNRMEELNRLNDGIEEIGAALGWPRRSILDLALACEELIVNIVHYGYPPGIDGMIEVVVKASQEEVEIRIADHGVPFNPLAEQSDPLSLLEMDLEERPVGGLGIFFVKKTMDTVHYEYEDGMNRLLMRKRLQPVKPWGGEEA